MVRATRREHRSLRREDRVGVRVGKVLGHSKAAKHFRWEKITDTSSFFEHEEERIAEGAALDGIYMIRTSIAEEEMGAEAVVTSYRDLSEVERDLCIFKDFALEVEPVGHRRTDRLRAHFFLCMVALYVYRHMEAALAPMFFVLDDSAFREARRNLHRASRHPLRGGPSQDEPERLDNQKWLIHDFRSLLEDLATLTKNIVQAAGTTDTFAEYARPTEPQAAGPRSVERVGPTVAL